MSNSLVPYSFTPGAKAKAQEVNANFIALAEKIEENREYTKTQIDETIEKIEASSSESEAKKADKNLGNTSLISNSILEAPNGVVTASENIITVKEGLKVLIPDGFNEDGTIKSITYEVPEDINVTAVNNSYVNCIYVTPDGCGYAQAYLASAEKNFDKRGIVYDISENKSYLYNTDTSDWEPIKAVVVALYTITDNVVTFKEIEKPVRVLSYADRNAVLNWMMPCYKNAVSKVWESWYVAPCSGWIYVFATAEVNAYQYIVLNGVYYTFNWVRYGDQASSCCMVPVKKGDSYSAQGAYFGTTYVYFIPMQGDM